MKLASPEPLLSRHRLEAFNCGRSTFNDWLQRQACLAQSSGAARTFVVADGLRVAGYASVTMGQVDTMSTGPQNHAYPIPVMILARLAVCRQYQGLGVGAGLLREMIVRMRALAAQTGIQAMLTQPLDEEGAGFFQRFGFVASPLKASQLLLLCKNTGRPDTNF
jgi:GNAT superfamily N-acetyltransferase